MPHTTLTLGGMAGQGLVTISDLLLKLLARAGYHLLATQDYMSRVRGGHNFIQIGIDADRIFAPQPIINILVALDSRSIDEHRHELTAGSIVLHDSDNKPPDINGVRFAGVPMNRFANKAGNPVYANAVALGAIAALLEIGMKGVDSLLNEHFGKKGEAAVEKNVAAAHAGYDHIAKYYAETTSSLPPVKQKTRMLINGAQAIGLGMMTGGLRFISAYPMSPSTSIFNYVTASAAELGILSEQAEDEIAAVNMALGASAAGVRTAVTTSGGGLDLMAEGISLAGVAETPIVIANIMRPGPATGLPTRTGQEDLNLVLNIGHGEVPRFVFAPGTAEEAFYTAIHAMNLADKYQAPVFLLGDQQLVDSYVTLDRLNITKVRIKEHLADPAKVPAPYQRYRITPNGVSPRLPYGTPGVRVMYDSHLHEEDGHITENADIVRAMVEKRFRKLKGMVKETGKPIWYGNKKPAITLACWGTSYGASREAVDALNRAGIKAGMAHFNRLAPFPSREARVLLANKKHVHTVEGNFTGQLAQLLARETGIHSGMPVTRYDGRPITARHIIDKLKEVHGNGKFKRISL